MSAIIPRDGYAGKAKWLRAAVPKEDGTPIPEILFGLPVIVDAGIPGGAHVNEVILSRLELYVADIDRTGFLPDYIRVVFDPPNYPALEYVVVGYKKDGQP